jgi:hypothetical protein
MSDWLESLTPDERSEWEEIARHAREETAQAIKGSSCVISMVTEPLDVKFAMELGLAIILDKPVLAVVLPGATVPPKLRQVADEVVELTDGPGSQAGQAEVQAAVLRMIAKTGGSAS